MNSTGYVDNLEYHKSIKLLRDYFLNKGFIEIPVQSRLSILAACEDPSTIGTFQYEGKVWPLPQTGQMWLEYELLKNPDLPGVFCQSTSYRQEPNPILGRHEKIFQMMEFESKGNIEDLKKLEIELLDYLGFDFVKNGTGYDEDTYLNTAKKMGVNELTAKEEDRILSEISPVYFLTDFPESTSPFWNMKRNNKGTANKIDVILYGIETIGSAERECDPAIMLDRFNTISNGEYANLLYSQFGRGRVMAELGEFLDLDFFPRFGGGIGMTRMMKALKHLNEHKNK